MSYKPECKELDGVNVANGRAQSVDSAYRGEQNIHSLQVCPLLPSLA